MNKPESESAEGLAVGLAYLTKSGFVFVRLDQVDLKEMPEKSGKESMKPEKHQQSAAIPQSGPH